MLGLGKAELAEKQEERLQSLSPGGSAPSQAFSLMTKTGVPTEAILLVAPRAPGQDRSRGCPGERTVRSHLEQPPGGSLACPRFRKRRSVSHVLLWDVSRDKVRS